MNSLSEIDFLAMLKPLIFFISLFYIITYPTIKSNLYTVLIEYLHSLCYNISMSIKCEFISESELLQGTEKWLKWRVGGFGASEVGVIAGTNKWKTVIDLWEEKTGLVKKEYITNAAIEHGIKTEPEARQRFIDATGIHMEPICAVSLENPI